MIARKYKTMEELLREIQFHERVSTIVIHTEWADFETHITLRLKDGTRRRFEDCMLDGCVRSVAYYLGISSEVGK